MKEAEVGRRCNESENGNAHRSLDRGSKGKRLLTCPGHKLEDNIEIHLAETERETVRCVKLAEVRISGCLSRTQLFNFHKILEFLEQLTF
jgi:hypothetical protein